MGRLGLFLLVACVMLAWPVGSSAQVTCKQPKPGTASAGGFVWAAARNAPTLVNVIVTRRERPFYEEDDAALFLPMSTPSAERSTASGFIISADGFIVTSAHVVHDAMEAWVLTCDGRRLRAAVTGFDRRTDVGVLKIDAAGLTAAQFAAGTRLDPGERVAALGSPFGFDGSVTSGVVSANPRFMPGNAGLPLIQTDVAINPGSSGGPLFNVAGTVVGMNSMIFSASGIYVGVSFALPIDRVLRVASEIRATGRVERGDIGARTQPVTPELAQAFGLETARGALVVQVQPGSDAARASLRRGDIVLSVDGVPLAPDGDPGESVAASRSRNRAALGVWRERKSHQVMLELSRPAHTSGPTPQPAPAPEIRLGLALAPQSATANMPPGAYVESVAGSGLLAGLEPGDRITAVNDRDISTPAGFDQALAAIGNAPVVALLVMRGSIGAYIPVRRRDMR